MGAGNRVLLSLGALLMPALASASVEYKCYMQLNNKTKTIVHFVVANKQRGQALPFSLPMTKLSGPERKVITKVYECKPAKAAFTSAAAQALEKILPR